VTFELRPEGNRRKNIPEHTSGRTEERTFNVKGIANTKVLQNLF
jgi:hypothetical protein